MTSPAPSRTRLLVAILNYRTAGLTIDCLRSLEDEVRSRGDVIVVVADNGSGDGSAQRLAAFIGHSGWSERIVLVPIDENLGYAGGNNAAIRQGLAAVDGPPPDYVLLLNSDTLVRPHALGALLDFMDGRPDAGIAGSRLEDPDGTQQHSCFRFPSVWSELDAGLRLGLVTRLLAKHVVSPPMVNEAQPAEWVAGASMIVRRAVLDEVGLLDDGYFLYFEDVDFCRQAARAGWACWYVPASRVVHLVGASSGVKRPDSKPRRLPPYWFAARQRYFVKNHGQLYALCADAALTLGLSLCRVRQAVVRKPDMAPPHLLRDFLHHRLRPSWGVRR